MRIECKDTVAIAVDFQERLIPVIDQKARVVENAVKLLRGLTILDIPIIITQQYTKGLGSTVAPIKEAVAAETPVIDKLTFGCCEEPAFMETLQKLNRKTILLCGVESHICVLQTLLGLIERNFRVVLVEDCVGSRRETDLETALKRAYQAGALAASYESLLFELMGSASHYQFKAISKLIK